MKLQTRLMAVAGVYLIAADLASASGGGDGGGGVIPTPVNVAPGQVLLGDSFAWGVGGMRPTGGNGTLQWMGQHDLSGVWAEFPNNNTEVWTAVNHNLESAGQAWLLFKMDNPQFDSFSGTVELHTNGMAGQSVSMKVTRQNFDTLTVRYDPVGKTVSGFFNGQPDRHAAVCC
jgi:hypothetical protein